MDKQKAKALRTTLLVLIALAALTGIEFWVASLEASAIALMIIAMIKASLILYYFMAFGDLWSEEKH